MVAVNKKKNAVKFSEKVYSESKHLQIEFKEFVLRYVLYCMGQ